MTLFRRYLYSIPSRKLRKATVFDKAFGLIKKIKSKRFHIKWKIKANKNSCKIHFESWLKKQVVQIFDLTFGPAASS